MISAKIENGILQFYDEKTHCRVLDGTALSVSYTLQTDDVTKGERPHEQTPYASREECFDQTMETETGFVLIAKETGAVCVIEPKEDRMEITLTTSRLDLSEFGLNIPFNFMGKLNCGGYKNQYLFNSVYRSKDEDYKFCFLKNVNGSDLVVLFDSAADGWKMEYSSYVGGHYFVSLKCLANFDKVYGTKSNRHFLKLCLYTCEGYNEALLKASQHFGVPAAYYENSYSFDGTGKIKLYGECDEICVCADEQERFFPCENGCFDYCVESKGKVFFIPYYKGKKGMDCSVFVYGDLAAAYKLANDAMLSKPLNEGNLCECQCWASAMLKYMLKYGRNEAYTKRLYAFFDLAMTHEAKNSIERLSILDVPSGEYPAYHIFRSKRIQEQAFGISIFLDAYKMYEEEKFLRYAVNSLNTFIDCYQKEDGRIETWQNNRYEDYSTITCLLIPIADMAEFFRDRDNELYQKYFDSASRLARYVYNRGFSFPTEGGDSPLAEEQIEDGSVSCSALTLLYYCAKLKRNEEFLSAAEKILEFHENWVMSNHDANVYRSSLRWWETRWEGDGDGPALCCGHAWTIWRSEADFWYYKLTGNIEYLQKAWCGFTTNFAKFDKDGKAKSIYNEDYITGGGFGTKRDVKFRIAPRFPDREDIKTARYAYSRAAETIFKESCPRG